MVFDIESFGRYFHNFFFILFQTDISTIINIQQRMDPISQNNNNYNNNLTCNLVFVLYLKDVYNQ